MSESANGLIHKILQLSPKLAINGSAGAATLVPSHTLGQALNTHGVWLLSYAEWIKITGAIWVLLLIIESLVRHCKSLIKVVKKWKAVKKEGL